MTTTKTSIALIAYTLLISGCKKDILYPMPDENYPYTYYALSQQEWEQLNSEFKSVNEHDSLFLNEYGFLEGKIFLGKDAVIDADLIVSQTESVIHNYSKYFGIHENAEINLSEELITWDEFIGHGQLINVYDYFKTIYFFIYDQQAMMKEIYGVEYEIDPDQFVFYFFLRQSKLIESKFESAQINFWYFESDNSLEISGNWFSKAFFPSFQIYNEKAALKIAAESFSDELDKSKWTSKNVKLSTQIDKIMFPLRFSDRIEIHECWKIIAEGFGTQKYYTITTDTQTGEVLSKESEYYVF